MEESITELFSKYEKRLARIGLCKAFLWALVIGFVFEFATAFIIWFFKLNLLTAVLIMVGVLLVVTAAATPIVYRLIYKPTKRRIARILDRTGLDERLVTMCECEGDTRPIAEFQRRDARMSLTAVSEKQFLFRLSRLAIVALSVSIVFGLTMGVVSTLAKGGVLPGGNEIFAQDPKDPSEDEGSSLCIVVYAAGEGGSVSGEAVQKLNKGEDTTPVTAMPDLGYDFVGWSDGDPRATRIDYSVQESMTITAMFAKRAEIDLPEVEGGGVDAEGQGGNASSGNVGQGGGSGGTGNNGEMEGEDVNGEGGGGAGAVKDNEDNSVIDGTSKYQYVFDYEAEIEELLNNENLPDEIKDFLNNYLDALKQMQEADKNAN